MSATDPDGGAWGGAVASTGGSGTEAHAASIPTTTEIAGKRYMLFLFLEALFAMALLIFIVWWTMFSGRKKGEPPADEGDR